MSNPICFSRDLTPVAPIWTFGAVLNACRIASVSPIASSGTYPETNNKYHVHISDVAGRTALERNAWVSFDIASRKGKGTSAINVVPIDCPARYLLQGTITRFVENKGFGFIRYG